MDNSEVHFSDLNNMINGTINILTNINANVYDKNIFPLKTYKKYLDNVILIQQKLGKNIFDIMIMVSPIYFLIYNINTVPYGKNININFNDVITYFEKYSNNKTLVLYNYVDEMSIYFYEYMHVYNLLNNDINNVFIISKNNYILDGILKYNKHHRKKINLSYFLYTYEFDRYPLLKSYFEENGVNPIVIKHKLYKKTMQYIKKNMIGNYNLFIIDFIIYIKTLAYARSSVNIQTIIQLIFMGLNNLTENATLIINSPVIHQQSILDFFIYIGTFFNSFFTKSCEFSYYGELFLSYIFKGFNKNNYKDNSEGFSLLYDYDDSYGYNFSFNRNEYNFFKKYTDHPYNDYNKIENIVNLNISQKNTKVIDKIYKQYKSMIKYNINENIKYLVNIMDTYYHRYDLSYIKELSYKNFNIAYEYAIKHNIPLKTNYKKEKILLDIFKKNVHSFNFNLKTIKYEIDINTDNYIIGNYDKIVNTFELLKYNKFIHTNYEELDINNKKTIMDNIYYKEIINLYNNINIFDTYVNKIYYYTNNNDTLLSHTKFYINNHHSNLSPMYKHIKISNNKKYNKASILLCNGDNILSILYGLLYTKVNGTTILKISLNYNLQMIMLLITFKCSYKKFFLLKPYNIILNNYIYIIGINKVLFTNVEINNLEYIKNQYDNNIIVYPTKKININFYQKYINIIEKIMTTNSDLNDFIKFYNINKNDKNNKLEKYLKNIVLYAQNNEHDN
jgi:hypothetical protein